MRALRLARQSPERRFFAPPLISTYACNFTTPCTQVSSTAPVRFVAAKRRAPDASALHPEDLRLDAACESCGRVVPFHELAAHRDDCRGSHPE